MQGNERDLFQSITKNEKEVRKKERTMSVENITKIKSKNGITLIALVISIIVMLILAGVSLNATIGDNGIITQAQNATYMQSIAVLEEYFNNYYVEHYEEMNSGENKITELLNNSESSSWIYSPRRNGYGSCDYVLDENGKAYYIINKANLPEELQKNLKDGNTLNKTYSDFIKLEDLYGITSDLKVYYCKNENNILGISKQELDNDDPTRIVFSENNNWAKRLNNGNEMTAEDIKKVNRITLTGNISNEDMKELYNFYSLKSINIVDAKIDSLDGIENANRIEEINIENSTIGNYSKLKNLKNIATINLKKMQQEQVEKFFTENFEAEWNNLQILNIKNCTNLTNLEFLEGMTEGTKKAVKIFDCSNSKIESLKGIENYVNIESFTCDSTNIKDLKELKNMNNLKEVYASYCHNLGNNEVYDLALENNGKNKDLDSLASLEGKKLKRLSLRNAYNLKWISYIKEISNLQQLFLDADEKIVMDDMVLIKDIVINISNQNKTIPSKYLALFNTEKAIDYTNRNLEDSSAEIASLKNNKEVEKLSLYGCSKLTNERLNEILSTNSNLKVLQLYGLSNLTSIEFVKNMPNLVELDLRGTNVTDLSLLENLTINKKISLKTLAIDNENIELNTIQAVISNCLNESQKGFFDNLTSGILITNYNLLKKINTCTEITNFLATGYNYILNIDANENKFIDFSNCQNLVNISIGYPNFSIKVPRSCKNYAQNATTYLPDITEAENLKYILLSITTVTQDGLNKLFENAKILNNLESINISSYSSEMFNSLEVLNNFSDNNVVKHINLGNYDYNYYNLKSLSGIEKLKKLETIDFDKTGISSLDGLENLVNLRSIVIKNSSITDIAAITNLKKLEILDLNNNALYDNFYKNVGNETIKYNTLQILKDLNKNGKLLKINLEKNVGLINKEQLIKDGNKWSDDSKW